MVRDRDKGLLVVLGVLALGLLGRRREEEKKEEEVKKEYELLVGVPEAKPPEKEEKPVEEMPEVKEVYEKPTEKMPEVKERYEKPTEEAPEIREREKYEKPTEGIVLEAKRVAIELPVKPPPEEIYEKEKEEREALESIYRELCKKELAYDYLCGPDPSRCVDCQGRPIEPELYKNKCPDIDPEGFGYKYRELRRYSDVYVCCRKETCLEYQRRLYEMGVMRYEYEEKKDPFQEFFEECKRRGGGIMSKESYEYTYGHEEKKPVILDEYDGWVCVR